MSEETSSAVLETVLKDISASQKFLDDSVVTLSKALKSVNFKCIDDETDIVDKTRTVLDAINKNISECHSYFYKFYDAWKDKQTCCNGRRISSGSSESVLLDSPDLINSSFIFSEDNRNDSCINGNNASLSDKEKSESRTDENKTNTDDSKNDDEKEKRPTNDRDAEMTSTVCMDTSTGDGGEQQQEDKVKDQVVDESLPDLQETSKEAVGNDRIEMSDGKGQNSSIQTEIETRNESVNNTTSSSLEKDNQAVVVNIDHIEVDESANLKEINDNKYHDEGNSNDNDLDPLSIDNNMNDDDTTNDSVLNNALDNKQEDNSQKCLDADGLKSENTFKIKCVDIKTLLEVSSDSSKTKDTTVGDANTSVVVISDSDNESSPKNPKQKARSIIPKIGSEVTVIPIKSDRKVVVLNDSDSEDCQRGRPIRNKIELRKRPLRNPVAEKVNSLKRKTTTMSLRNRPGADITNVSSLSEISTTNSDSQVEDTHLKKKSKSKEKKTATDESILHSIKDKKFRQRAYVPLRRIPPDKLKENYELTVLKKAVEKLTNMDSLKRSRRKDSKSSDSGESVTSNTKKKHCSKKSNAEVSEDLSASADSDVSMVSDPLKINDDDIVEQLKEPEDRNSNRCQEELAEALLNRIGDEESRSKASSDSDNKKSDDENTNKTKEAKAKADKAKEVVEVGDTSNSDKEKGENSGSDAEAKRRKQKLRKDKLETENSSESDSGENFSKFMKKKEETWSEKNRLKKKRGKYVLRSSGSESASSNKSRDSSPGLSSKSNSDTDKNKGATKEKKKQNRTRIRKMKDSSDEAEDDDKTTRKNIRKVWSKSTLSESTIAAEKEEKERKARIAEKQKKYNLIFESDALEKATVDKVVLDFDDKTKKELLKIDSRLVKSLKPHQVKGIKFMWDTCFESLERAKNTKGSGCILAHCMGLGKTLQVIALVHTLLTNEEKTGVRKALIVCPLNTVLNWVAEFKKWLPSEDDLEVFELVSCKQNIDRMYNVKEWERLGGALIIGYDMFRNLTNPSNKRLRKSMRETFQTCLVDPGPQLVVCDEGHLLKNEKTSTSIAMNRLQCMRRVVLTGTPLQNNLKEYFCMVQFVKPNLLGTYKEYLNRFVNPITNGQYTDSTPHDINIMRKRSHVLHKLLDGVVQRRDYSVLAPFLPPKHEYVLFVSLTELQIKLYRHYMRERSGQRNSDGKGKSFLFVDFNEFQRICTHPRVLLDKSNQVKQARWKNDSLDDESEGSFKDFIDDESEKSTSSSSSSSSNNSDAESDGSHKNKSQAPSGRRRITRATAARYEISDNEQSDEESPPDPSEWWKEFCTDEDLDNVYASGKLSLLFEILQQCESIGDKVLIFSQSLYSLNVIEYFLSKIDDATQNSETNSFCGFSGSWALGLDYFRLDGSSSCDNRAAWCKTFNDPNNIRARVFLISTRAGSLGINLVAANRVIIFDVSWNPSYDTQSIYRVYRFGQTKPSYVYRFVTLGTMEMKIYERQVTKQAISKRVIDEQQIDRHYNQSDLAELYRFEPVPVEERPIPLVPKDVLLGELLQANKKIYSYHEHQTLLENKVDEVLDEEERKAAWEEFENEKKAKTYSGTIAGYPATSLYFGLQSILRRENPTWNDTQISEGISEKFKMIEDEMASGGKTTPLLQQVILEMRAMHQAQQQQQQQEVYRLLEQQALLHQLRQQQYLQLNQRNYPQMNNSRMANHNYPRHTAPTASGIARSLRNANNNPVDYIDLND